MGDLIRIKPKSAPYRRAGLAFETSTEFVEFDAATLTPEQNARLAADDRLTIEICEDVEVSVDDRQWRPIDLGARVLAQTQVEMLAVEDWAEMAAEVGFVTGDGSGSTLPPATEVQLIDTLSAAVEEVRPELIVLGVDPDGDVLGQLIDLATSVAQLTDSHQAEIAALGEEIDQLRATHTPPDDSQDGGTGDAAGPAAGDDPTSAASPPAGGSSAQAAGGESPPPAAQKSGKKPGVSKPD